MPNYSKTSIYKICCLDTTIKDIYIGSTCNFSRRKYQHKNLCNDENNKDYNIKVYKFIRDNGGWINWNMIQIKEFSCENKREKETEERKCIEELKPTLNVNIPTRSEKEWRIENKETLREKQKIYQKLDYVKQKKETYTKNHRKEKQEYDKQYRKIKIKCDICNCSVSKHHFKRHLKSKKHINNISL